MSEIRDSSNQPIYSTGGVGFGSNAPYKRIVAKAGTNVLTGGTEHLDKSVITQLVSQVVELHQQGVQVIIVTSGAVASGRQLLDEVLQDKRGEPSRQVQAAVGQKCIQGSGINKIAGKYFPGFFGLKNFHRYFPENIKTEIFYFLNFSLKIQ